MLYSDTQVNKEFVTTASMLRGNDTIISLASHIFTST